jgi:hypothetical protein
MGNYHPFLTMLSTKFQRYVMENEKLGEKMPLNAMVVFQVDGEDDFNNWHKDTSLRNREKDQTVILIKVKKWREHSSIEELHLAEVGEKLELQSVMSVPA